MGGPTEEFNTLINHSNKNCWHVYGSFAHSIIPISHLVYETDKHSVFMNIRFLPCFPSYARITLI